MKRLLLAWVFACSCAPFSGVLANDNYSLEAEADKQTSAQDYLQSEHWIEHQQAVLHTRIYAQTDRSASAEHILILPSLGRGVEDYTEEYRSSLTKRLVEAGYRVVLMQPRGIGQSRGDLTPAHMSMSLFAQDIKAVLDDLKISQAHFIGHAFGNRLARTFATLFPDRVSKLVLLAAGGGFPLSTEQRTCLLNSFDLQLAEQERTRAIACAFFAQGNDAGIWLDGWYPKLAQAQVLAATMINGDFFARAGGKPFLLVQPTEDFIAPPELAGLALKKELGEQVTYVEIERTGHALTSERPEVVSDIVIDYLKQPSL